MAVNFDPITIAADLAQCLCAALKDPARGLDVWEGECCIRPGAEVAWDSCCETGGQAWVLLKGGMPTTVFPLPDMTSSDTHCTKGSVALILNFEVGVLRCVCWDACDCDTAEANAGKLFGDLQAMLRGINCCFSAATDDCDMGWRLNSFEMLGPAGGCGGSKASIAVHTNYPCCP